MGPKARRLWFRILIVLLPAAVVFAAEVFRHEVLPDFLHDFIPEMLGNLLTGAAALVISAVILIPIYRRLEATDAQLQATRVAQAVAEEREQLARELHDGVAQALFFLNVKATALERSLAGVAGAGARPIAAEIAKAIHETDARVRDAIFDLRTGPEPGEPLDAWIRGYAQRFAELHTLTGDVEERGRPRGLHLEDQLHTMAIVREALHNVAKHAQAGAFAVRLDWTPVELVIIVSDDGRGLPTDRPGPAQGRYGIAALLEHAQAARGTVTLTAGLDGAGTAVTFRMPYRAAPHRA
ncbi:MAG TPA: histidine kinase [bacterium]|nr:histidine kinase [bacterium]